MARKYLIETFGCQMNVHDSERMAGLLEQAGFEATDDAADADVVVINTCSVRERAEEKLYTRLGELRQMAPEQGHDPIVAVAGCVAQQEGEAILKRVAGRRRRHRRHAGDPPAADARRTGRATPHGRDRPQPVRRRDVSAGRDAAQRPGEGLRHDHRGVQRVLQLLRRPLHARARADAAEGGHPRRGPGGGGRRPQGSAAPRPDRQPLRGARRPVLRLHGAPRGGPRGRRASSGSASRARIRATSRRAFSTRWPAAQDLPPPASAGAVGLDARPRRDAPPLHARELSRARRRDPSRRCRTWRSRPI